MNPEAARLRKRFKSRHWHLWERILVNQRGAQARICRTCDMLEWL